MERKEAGAQALDALLTLAGQNTFNHDALVGLLINKGVTLRAGSKPGGFFAHPRVRGLQSARGVAATPLRP